MALSAVQFDLFNAALAGRELVTTWEAAALPPWRDTFVKGDKKWRRNIHEVAWALKKAGYESAEKVFNAEHRRYEKVWRRGGTGIVQLMEALKQVPVERYGPVAHVLNICADPRDGFWLGLVEFLSGLGKAKETEHVRERLAAAEGEERERDKRYSLPGAGAGPAGRPAAGAPEGGGDKDDGGHSYP